MRRDLYVNMTILFIDNHLMMLAFPLVSRHLKTQAGVLPSEQHELGEILPRDDLGMREVLPYKTVDFIFLDERERDCVPLTQDDITGLQKKAWEVSRTIGEMTYTCGDSHIGGSRTDVLAALYYKYLNKVLAEAKITVTPTADGYIRLEGSPEYAGAMGSLMTRIQGPLMPVKT